MEKFCVFCGQYPECKNKEHVLPHWLIKMTGDPKRIATFGVDFAKQPFVTRQFSFDALTFPACTECNNCFSNLEAAAEPVLRALLSHLAVSASDLIILLDWLDKVRVGLWLGYFYLNKNPLGITPSFHIENRIGQYDRMVGIIRLSEAKDGLTFIGPESMFYQLSPTCFGLRVNGLCFVNASRISMCSQRLGFPFAEPVRFRDDRKLEIEIQPGSSRIMCPIERSPALPRIVSLYQPVFRILLESENAAGYLATDWVSTYTADSQKGYGKLFLEEGSANRVYPEATSTEWIPQEPWQTWEMVKRVPQFIYERLSKDFEDGISISSNRNQRKHMRQQATMIKAVDRAILKKLKEPGRWALP